jgi:hypothetical protein
VAAYRITLFDNIGSVDREDIIEFEDDKAALDHIGSLRHPHELFVWRGPRFVARFPAPALAERVSA